ncbi:ImmA/IrrE family metallo-endopeptidase [Actinomyces faecalis]|uniref:ImmA/IrrE family metallo-endopeptidase n=1 Tax=Actinomyces faecalis TaxID=2722820 RepID=UPI0015556FA5|nr:ImmA/IrrE family metallo-endopeptidase [Actinomyces faecalis]
MLVWQQARADAESVARGYDRDGVFPRDVKTIAEMIGLEVIIAPLTEDTSGLIIKRNKYSNPQIYVDSTELEVRQRFTIAHEIGHYFERMNADDSEYSFVDRRGSGQYDLHEFYADEFAGTLLMPQEEIQRLREAGKTAVEMAAHFGVSVAAMNTRLKRIDIADQTRNDQ